ncbi:MAG: hypothetical protein QNJ54_21895 [Prochloraceae cyanobacterium]|nr:hypothetical protein [Prochloraceae cyanobacterium]
MILWGKEHQARAQALAEICGEQSMALANLPQTKEGIQPLKSKDATLTVWGHGNANKFCEMYDSEFGVIIKAWKKQNQSLKTVELVTCDAQHNIKSYLAGYASRVAKFVQQDYKDVTIKALPVGQHSEDKSILWASADTSTFCYLTAPSEETFNNAKNLFEKLRGNYSDDFSLVAQAMLTQRKSSPPNNFTVNGGLLESLRGCLAVIKTK